MQRITGNHATSHPLFSVAATRLIEQQSAATLPTHTLMQRAGLAVTRLALALAPHSRSIWIACGPGNNGGDGFEAAMHLHQWGKRVVVTWAGLPPGKTTLPPDAQASYDRALAAGVRITDTAPTDFDVCIDALLGIGASPDPQRTGSHTMTQWLDAMRASGKPCLSVDIPTGLNADTGHTASATSGDSPRGGKRFTLSLLTLKPGLFTAHGRDSAGEVWLDDLGVEPPSQPDAWLIGEDRVQSFSRTQAAHASHKGSYGDVAVIGGELTAHSHMAGAALLAARAALVHGAGRVYVALLGGDGPAALTVDTHQPELMFRHVDALDLKNQTVVCGCGGGDAVSAVLPKVLSTAHQLVLDADALNAIAGDTALQTLLRARHGRGYQTVLTPHPLEAARLAGTGTAAVQADRLTTAQQLADNYKTVVVLKGSGSVITAPGEIPCINSSGNALLATAGTGDVLAGMVGAALASGQPAFAAACAAVFSHGRMADRWLSARPGQNLTASDLCERSSL
ncbi:MAG: NAD(P)H-hydrate dehydratase [Pseudomonadota bacterium]